MWKSLLIPVVSVLILPVALHGQCKEQGNENGAGQGNHAGMQMDGAQGGGMMMQRNFVRDVMAEAAALELTDAQVTRLEPLAARIDGMNEMFAGLHRTHAGRNLTATGRDSMRTTHMDVRRTNEQEVLREVKAVLGAEMYVRALELLVVRPGRMQ